MKHLLFYVLYAFISLGLGLMIAAELQGASVFIGFLYAQLLFTGCIVAHEVIASRAWQSTTKMQLKALAKQHLQMRDEFRHLRNETSSILDILTARKTNSGPRYVKMPKSQTSHSNVLPIRPFKQEKEIGKDKQGGRWYEVQKIAKDNLGRTWYEAQENEKDNLGRTWYEAQEQEIKKNVTLPTPLSKNPAVIRKVNDYSPSRIDYDFEHIIPQSQNIKYAQDTTVNEIRQAIRNQNFDIFVQPIVETNTLIPKHFECFTNIIAPDGNVISPKTYLEKAEYAGLLPNIDFIVLTKTLERVVSKIKKMKTEHVFFNISSFTMQANNVFSKIEQFFQTHTDVNKKIIFEISHKDVSSNLYEFKNHFRKLKQFGAKISLDNVRTMEIDTQMLVPNNVKYIKVDINTLNMEMKRSSRDPYHPKNIKKVFDRAGIIMIVEKIETQEQLMVAQKLNIPLVQGFLFGKPTPIDEINLNNFSNRLESIAV